ncbi:MAG TPA: AtpZ/AtpI family protein [Chitinophagaceae bacterium]|nr:AtpZ/AtpI family protein [Chitinophagaceae bacterium]HRX92786.1 AtpZ/AtpI family protein [Chitinophagaceae bacterium]
MKQEEENINEVFSRSVGEKEKQKLKAQNETKRSVWSAFGLFGIVGWTIVMPTLLGAVLGKWLDKTYPQSFSWTLTCLLTGLLIGCLAAWRWIKMEHKDMHQQNDNNNE